jgi:threonine aldolase
MSSSLRFGSLKIGGGRYFFVGRPTVLCTSQLERTLHRRYPRLTRPELASAARTGDEVASKNLARVDHLDLLAAVTALICLENTHTAENGAVLPLEHLAAVRALASRMGVPVHLDGARLFNAAVALATSPAVLADQADSVMVSLCKGLGAPAGAILAGSEVFARRALVFRKMLGGVMRQSGLLAACAIAALQVPLARLCEDHARARELASGLAQLDARFVDLSTVETNLVTVDLTHTGWDAAVWTAALEKQRVLVAPLHPSHLRLVTHSQIDPHNVATALRAFATVLSSGPAPYCSSPRRGGAEGDPDGG